MAGPVIREARPDDLEAIEAVAVAVEEPTADEHWGFRYLEFLMADGVLLVGEVEGRIVGYGGAIAGGGRHPSAHVTDLFVHPDHRDAGAGGALLGALLDGPPDIAWTTCSSSDPRAQTLYARSGLQPLWPVLYLAGAVGPDAGVPGAEAEAIAPEVAAGFELGWSGRELGPRYGHWAARPGGSAVLVLLDGRPAAVGTVRDGRKGPGRVIDHAVVAPEADPVRAVMALVSCHFVRGDRAAPTVLHLVVPGPQPALIALLRMGFRITDHDTFCATRPDLVDPIRTVIDPSFA